MGDTRRTVAGEGKKNRIRRDTWAIIATGPSVDETQAEKIHAAGVKTCVVNDGWRLAPWADLLYACDYRWFDVHYDTVRAGFAGEIWTVDKKASEKYAGLNYIPGKNGDGLAENEPIHYGGNSGYQAINLLYARYDAAVIILVGYDMGHDNGKKHFFGDHPGALDVNSPYPMFVRAYETIGKPEATGLTIINATRKTALTCFPQMTIDDALRKYPNHVSR